MQADLDVAHGQVEYRGDLFGRELGLLAQQKHLAQLFRHGGDGGGNLGLGFRRGEVAVGKAAPLVQLGRRRGVFVVFCTLKRDKEGPALAQMH